MGALKRGLRKTFDQGLGTVAAGAHIFQPGAIGGQTGIFSNLPRTSATGLTVTTDKALGYSPFWQGVRVIGEAMAGVPLFVYEQMDNGDKRKATDHPLYNTLHDQFNPRLTSFQARETMIAHLCTWGNSYWVIQRNGRGQMQLTPLAPERMQIWLDTPDGDPTYVYSSAFGNIHSLAADDVFHVPALAWNGLMGLAPIRYHMNAIGLGLATEEHGSRFFANGVTANFVLSTENGLSDTALKHLRDAAQENHTGLANAWDPWILEEGLKPFTLSMPNDSAQWLETRKHQIHEIARVLNLPPYKIGSVEAGAVAYSSVEQYAVDFVVGSLMPWAQRIEQAIGQQLLGPDWVGNGGRFFAQFQLAGLLRGDAAARAAFYHQGITDGWMLRSEPRELEDMPKVEGLDKPLIPLNLSAIETAESDRWTKWVDRGVPLNRAIAKFDMGAPVDGGDESRVLLRTGDVGLTDADQSADAPPAPGGAPAPTPAAPAAPEVPKP